MTLRTYRNLPAIPTGYPLDDVWSVVVPIARTNEVLNPSGETTTTGYTAGAGSLARSTAQQYHGAYSFAYTPSAATTDGFYYGTITTTSGQIRAESCKFRGIAGVPYALTFATTAGVDLVVKPFIATGRWQWVILYYTETSSTTRRIYFRKNGSASVAVFYVDGVQSEVINAGELASTYIDGDQLGLVPNQSPPAYFWNGTPHASTSTRSGQTRAGGMVIPFSKYKFLITALIGLGLASVQNVATDYARIDGSYDDYTRKPSRQFTITGRFQGRAYAELRRNRSGLAQLFDRDLVGLDQRLTLLRHVEDGYGRVVSSDIRVLAKYESGFGGNTDNMHAETVPLTFTQYLPGILSDGESGTSLNVQQTITNTNRVAERLANGTWRALASGTNAAVNALIYGPDGLLYLGGDFTTTGTRVASWDGTSLTGLGTGLNASVQTLAVGPDGRLYAGGAMFTVGGNTGSVAVWNGATWAIVGATGVMTGTTAALLFAPDGTLYAGGMSAASHATLDSWNGTVWTNIITHTSVSEFFALARGLDGRLFAGGIFANLNADANQDGIASYKAGAWSALSTGINGNIEDSGLTIGLDGRLYMICVATNAGGVTILNAAVWNGVAFAPLGAGLTGQALEGSAITLADGTIIMGGSFTASNNVTLPDPLARWNGSTFVALDANLPTDVSNNVLSLAASLDGKLAVGYDNTGSSTAAGITTVTNPGTARSYPTVTIAGPSSGTARIYQIINTTTNRAIYLNLTLNAGETARLVFTPDNLSFTSDFQGNIAGSILPGSNEADFFLQPGANTISLFSASSTVTATLFYRPAYASIDDVP